MPTLTNFKVTKTNVTTKRRIYKKNVLAATKEEALAKFAELKLGKKKGLILSITSDITAEEIS